MRVDVTVRHADIPDIVKNHARSLAEALADGAKGVQRVETVLNREKGRYTAETLVTLRGAATIVGKATEHELGAAIEEAARKAERQLRRLQGRREARRTQPRGEQ